MKPLYSKSDRAEGLAIPPFSKSAHCPKCLSEPVAVRWIGDGCRNAACTLSGCAAEHFLRHCQTCHFQWAERVETEA